MLYEDFQAFVARLSHRSPDFNSLVQSSPSSSEFIADWFLSYSLFPSAAAYAAATARLESLGQWGHKTLLEDILSDLRASQAKKDRAEANAELLLASRQPEAGPSLVHDITTNSKEELAMYQVIAEQVYTEFEIPFGSGHPSPMWVAKQRGIDEEVKGEIRARFREWVYEDQGVAL